MATLNALGLRGGTASCIEKWANRVVGISESKRARNSACKIIQTIAVRIQHDKIILRFVAMPI